MNKAKVILATLAVICAIGGAFALNAKKTSAPFINYRLYSAGPGLCQSSYQFGPAETGGTLIYYEITPGENDCLAADRYVFNP